MWGLGCSGHRTVTRPEEKPHPPCTCLEALGDVEQEVSEKWSLLTEAESPRPGKDDPTSGCRWVMPEGKVLSPW